LLFNGKVVETFFYEQTNDAVAVEDEVCAAGLVIANHAVGI
jgi:hypothetical protein